MKIKYIKNPDKCPIEDEAVIFENVFSKILTSMFKKIHYVFSEFKIKGISSKKFYAKISKKQILEMLRAEKRTQNSWVLILKGEK